MPSSQTRNILIAAVVAIVVIGGGVYFWQAQPWAASGPPNVVLISLDAVRADHLGCYGHTAVKTPNIDRLASAGVRFDRCISPAPLTLPANASLLTGTWPFMHGLRVNANLRLHDRHVTLAEQFKQAGYETVAEVGTALLRRRHGLDQGFETYNAATAEVARAPSGGPRPMRRDAEEVCDAAIQWIRDRGARPFFLFVQLTDAETPYDPPPRFGIQYEEPYYAEIAYIDEQVGRVLDVLDQQHIADDTLVVLTAACGTGRDEHGEWSHGVFLYDTTLRVPLIMRAPGRLPAGQSVADLVRLVDVAPTILDVTGTAALPNAIGISLRPMLGDAPQPVELTAYAESLMPRFADYLCGVSPLWAVVRGDWKYVQAPRPELYRLSDDPGETTNLAASQPEQVARMRAALGELVRQAPPGAPPGGMAPATGAQQRALAGLGYVVIGRSAASADGGAGANLFESSRPDPKDFVEELRLAGQAVELSGVGRLLEAQDLLVRLIERLKQRDSDRPWPRAALARILLAQNKPQEAVEQLAAALALEPDDVDVLVEYAGALIALRRIDEAGDACRKAVAADEQNAGAHHQLGLVLLLQKQLDEALGQFERAIALDPALARSHDGISQIRYAQGDLEAALAANRQALELEPLNPAFIQRRGDLLLAEGRLAENNGDEETKESSYKAAILHYQQVLRLRPYDVMTFGAIGETLRLLGDNERARQAFQAMTENDPNVPDGWASLAYLLIDMGETKTAIETLHEGLENNPGNPELAHVLAWLLATSPEDGLRNGDEAVRLAEIARDAADESNDAVLDTLAAALAEAGRFDEAVQTIDAAIALVRETRGEQGAERLETLESRKRLYEAGQPFRDRPPAQDD